MPASLLDSHNLQCSSPIISCLCRFLSQAHWKKTLDSMLFRPNDSMIHVLLGQNLSTVLTLANYWSTHININTSEQLCTRRYEHAPWCCGEHVSPWSKRYPRLSTGSDAPWRTNMCRHQRCYIASQRTNTAKHTTQALSGQPSRIHVSNFSMLVA